MVVTACLESCHSLISFFQGLSFPPAGLQYPPDEDEVCGGGGEDAGHPAPLHDVGQLYQHLEGPRHVVGQAGGGL